MDPTRRNQISALYHDALTRAPDERNAFLTEACGDDEALRAEIESLLRYDAGSFLETPAAQVAVAEVAAAGRASMVHRQLGPYRILAPLGAGGMGEVYRAHDSKLGREVAIKILPPHFTSDPERRARFAREARMLASLNHAHIGAIYGLEDSDGVTALVLELVEGPTLADRLARGPLPVTKALAIARQVAEALDAAHERGIVHRDLKPSNIILQGDTAVTSEAVRAKVLDFGLAKPIAEAAEGDPTATVNDTADGRILGTPAYMSPEQARGLPVDKRTDIWAFGCVLYELLTGARAFRGHSTSELMVAILTLQPDLSRLPGTVPPRVVDLLQRCLMKDPRERLRDIGDARSDLKEVSEQPPGWSSSLPKSRSAWQRAATAAIGVAAIALAAWGTVASGLWPRSNTRTEWVNPLADARFTPVTNFPGTETQAAISPDGKFVAFLSDRDGPMNLMLTQVGTGRVTNLTPNFLPTRLESGAGMAPVGFSWDGSHVWWRRSGRISIVPLIGDEQRLFLGDSAHSPAWSPDGTALVYYNAADGDPLFVADRTGGNAREIFHDEKGIHNHSPVWSTDGQWIYFLHGRPDTGQMALYRIRPAGGSAEQLIDSQASVTSVAPLDPRTLLYAASSTGPSGEMLWALDLESRKSRPVTTGVDRYLTVAASADGRRIVATVVANPDARLWSLPLGDRVAGDRDVQVIPVPSVRALQPRIRGASLFYLSSGGAADGLWHLENGQLSEVWRGSDGALRGPAAVSRDGTRVAIVLRKEGKGYLKILTKDGSNSRDVPSSIDVKGVPDWGPDDNSIVTGGADEQGKEGLFIIPIEGGTPRTLTDGFSSNPVCSADGSLIVYAGAQVRATQPLLGVRPDGTAVPLPPIFVPARFAGHRFVPGSTSLVFMQSHTGYDEFWMLDLLTGEKRQVGHVTGPDGIRGFDITPDGKRIVFDRHHENSNIELIERPRTP